MYTPSLVSILFYDQPLSIFKFDDVMPTSRTGHRPFSELGFRYDFQFLEKILSLTMPLETSMIFSIHPRHRASATNKFQFKQNRGCQENALVYVLKDQNESILT